jgi:ATP-dependent Clp protease protease subunit
MMFDRIVRLLRDNAEARAKAPVRAEVSGDEARIYLYDVIVSDDWLGGVGAESFAKKLDELDVSVIHLHINSPGGEVFAARSIEAAIRRNKAKVVAHIDGLAASAASFVAVACDEVEIAKGGMLMIHKAWTCRCGNANDFVDSAAQLEKLDGTMADTYSEKTGLKVAKISEMMTAETWLTGSEAVELGFADRVAESNKQASVSGWDLSAYENAPQPPATAEDESKEEDDEAETEARERRLRLIELAA